MKQTVFLITLFCTFTASSASAQFTSQKVDLDGYFEALPLWFSTTLPEPAGDVNYFEFRIQNRLNLNWYATDNLQFTGGMRTRFFSGDLVRDVPGYAEAIDQDPGLLNLSWMVAETDEWYLHYIPDRLYGEWFNDDWSVRVGRQRVNWGINSVTNPNDLFNIYSFYDFAYPERPGSDAIRIQRFLDFASRVEVAIRPSQDMKESVAAFLYSWNQSGYDWQILGGYYRNQAAIGGGWAGSAGMAGVKGEISAFYDFDERENDLSLVAVISADYMFDNSLFLIVEGLYNSRGGQNRFSVIGQQLSADNPSFSRFQFTTSATYPISPILSGSITGVIYPDEQSVFLSPQFSWSVAENMDFTVLSQFFYGSSSSAFSDAGIVLAGSLKWNF
ncbi:MAG: hypothetical protein R6V27_05855 [Balneolaceae bacterium]